MTLPAETTGTTVEKLFFTPLYYPGSPLAVIRWWESRRLAFNVAVGAVGLVSLGTVYLTEGLLTGHFANWYLPLGMAGVYGVMANICYSMGAPIDLVARRMLGERGNSIGPVLLRYGFAFSLGLTLLPIPIVLFSALVRLIFGSP